MLILKQISDKEQRMIKSGNNALLKKKLLESSEPWKERVLLGKEDHRFNQAVYCTLLDIIDLLTDS